MSAEAHELVILGGGPCGLGAALRAQEKGLDWLLLEKEGRFGGLASSFRDAAGFTWDIGGHVLFSHYDTFDRFMEAALGRDGWLYHVRESWVRLRGRFVPYPFQNNLHRLDPEARWECVEGLLRVWLQRNGQRPAERPADFYEWMRITFGEGVTRHFMLPYNRKVWTVHPREMDYGWIGERVAVPDLFRVLRSVCTGQDDVSWGPNNRFRFPRVGGTGAIWEALGKQLDRGRVRLQEAVVRVDPDRRELETAAGRAVRYQVLLSTIPLDRLAGMTGRSPWMTAAGHLRHSAVLVVGIGLRGPVPDGLATKCWMYFPEEQVPFYRVTVFSNYSPANVPAPGEFWSLMTEVACQSGSRPEARRVAEEVVAALEREGLIPDRSAIVSVADRYAEYAYPIPIRGRDGVVDPLLRELEGQGIFSRGRFGAWKYEVGNMDHCFAQGYECVERIVAGGGADREPTLHRPDWVNSRRNK